ncbi:hypothetical protein GCM10027168_74790 [Streptomyces capparidis]
MLRRTSTAPAGPPGGAAPAAGGALGGAVTAGDGEWSSGTARRYPLLVRYVPPRDPPVDALARIPPGAAESRPANSGKHPNSPVI